MLTSRGIKLIISLLCVTVMALSSACSRINLHNEDNNKIFNLETINEEKVETLDGINEISIESVTTDVNIIPDNRDNVKLHFHGDIKANSIPKLSTNVDNKKIIISVKHPSKSINIKKSTLKLDVYVPLKFEANLVVHTSSGNINFLNQTVFKKINVNASSGNVIFDNIQVEESKWEVSSGDIRGHELISNKTEIDTSSGNVRIDNFKGEINAEASSGNIKIDFIELVNNVNLSTSSGNVEITLLKKSDFKVDAETSSGGIESEILVSTSGKQEKKRLIGVANNGTYKINLRTSSGNIIIFSK